jgi:hypothetical protein
MRIKKLSLSLALLLLTFLPSYAQVPVRRIPGIRVFFATTTTLTIVSEGAAVNFIDQGSLVTLQAAVSSSIGQVESGQVVFCDGDAAYCTDIHRFGTAQLRSDGTAFLRFYPGAGQHSYKAVFLGTQTFRGSASAAAFLDVEGQYPTAISIGATGAAGSYNVTATVTSAGGAAPPVGQVDFVDTANANAPLGSVTLPGEPGVMSWINPQTILTQDYPYSPVAADFDGDGRLDLARVNVTGHDVFVMLGDGNGTFEVKENLGETNPTTLAVADFNGDGIPDLAINNYGLGGGNVLLGNGDGTFAQPTQAFTTGDSPVAMVAADFNGDGIADLAVLNACGSDDCATSTSPGTVTILLGTGNGTLNAQAQSPQVGALPQSMVVGDFNGDGIPDLAIANTGSSAGNSVTILLGNGDGTFTTESVSPNAGQGFPGLAVADFNGDGKADLAVTDEFDYKMVILLGNGDGTFAPGPSNPSTGALPSAVAVGDFNGDGIPDLAVTNAIDDTVSILLGKGDGTFTAEAALATDTQPSSMAVGDFNGDGIDDLAVATYQGDTMAIFEPLQSFSSSVSLSQTLSANTPARHAEARYEGDTAHSSSVSGQVTLKSQTTVAITWNPPTAITYGTALSAAQLDATASVAGSLVYTPALGTVLGAGTHTLSVTFTPTDTADFLPATSTVTLTVNKAVLTVFPHNLSMVYGARVPALTFALLGLVNGDTQASATTGAPALATTATSTSPAGAYPITSAVGTLAAANYSLKFLTETMTVTKAALTVSPHNLSMTYGSPLPLLTFVLTGLVNGDTQATATTGHPRLTTTASSKSPVGAYPIDSALGTLTATNYTFNFLTATLTVTQAPLTATANNLTKAAGAPLPTLTANYTGFFNGDTLGTATTGHPRITTSATASSPAGSYAIDIAQGTLASTNYKFLFVNGTLTVTAAGKAAKGEAVPGAGRPTDSIAKSAGPETGAAGGEAVSRATPAINWATPAPISYGTPLTAAQLNATSTPLCLAAWGDSHTAGNRGNFDRGAWPELIGPLVGNCVVNAGIGGETSTQIAIREGGVQTHIVSASGNIPACPTLPCTGITVVWKPNWQPTTIENNNPYLPQLNIAGTLETAPRVHGTVTLSGGVYTFTPLAKMASAVTVRGDESFTIDRPYAGDAQVFWAGYNNWADTPQIDSDIACMAGTMTATSCTTGTPSGKPYLVLGLPVNNLCQKADSSCAQAGGDMWAGTTAYKTITATNSYLARTYPANFIDVLKLLVDSYNPSLPSDVADHANGLPPTSLRAINSVGTLKAAVGSTDTDCSAQGIDFAITTNNVAVGNVFTLDAGVPGLSENVMVLACSSGNGYGATCVSPITSCVRGWGKSAIFSHAAGSPFQADDGVHLNAQGDQIVANAVASAIYGTFTYTPPAGTVLTAGTHTLSVTFQPANAAGTASATASVSLTVDKGTPGISWAAPASVRAGTPLSALQLNAQATAPGSYVYTPAAGTALTAGSHLLSVAFTPADQADYTGATATVTLIVEPN